MHCKIFFGVRYLCKTELTQKCDKAYRQIRMNKRKYQTVFCDIKQLFELNEK